MTHPHLLERNIVDAEKINGSSRANLRSNLRPVPEKVCTGRYGICYEDYFFSFAIAHINQLDRRLFYLHVILNLCMIHNSNAYSGR